MTDVVSLIQPMPIAYGATALGVNDDLTRDQWVDLGREVNRRAEASMWWIGDWLLYAHLHFEDSDDTSPAAKETLQLIEQVMDMPQATLKVARWVSTQFGPERRREGLSFGHHKAVASLEPDVADALLEEALHCSPRESVHDLARRAQTVKAIDAPSEPAAKPAKVTLKLVALDVSVDDEALHRLAERAVNYLRGQLAQSGKADFVKVDVA